jgi:hypothetical protein
MKPGIAGTRYGALLLTLLLLLLALRVNAQDDPDADFLDMLEFIGEFGDEDGGWSELERELESVDAAGQQSDRDQARGTRDTQDDEDADVPLRPEAGIAGQNSSSAGTATATEAL